MIKFFSIFIIFLSVTNLAKAKNCSVETAEAQLDVVCKGASYYSYEELKLRKADFQSKFLLYDNCGLSQIVIYGKGPDYPTVISPFNSWQPTSTSPTAVTDFNGNFFFKQMADTAKADKAQRLTGPFQLNNLVVNRTFAFKECVLLDKKTVVAVSGLMNLEPSGFANNNLIEIDYGYFQSVISKVISLPDSTFQRQTLRKIFTDVLAHSADKTSAILQISPAQYNAVTKFQLDNILGVQNTTVENFWSVYSNLHINLASSNKIAIAQDRISEIKLIAAIDKLKKELTATNTKLTQLKKDSATAEETESRILIAGIPLEIISAAAAALGLITAFLGLIVTKMRS